MFFFSLCFAQSSRVRTEQILRHRHHGRVVRRVHRRTVGLKIGVYIDKHDDAIWQIIYDLSYVVLLAVYYIAIVIIMLLLSSLRLCVCIGTQP